MLNAHELFNQDQPNLTIAGTAVLLAGVGVATMFVDTLGAVLTAT